MIFGIAKIRLSSAAGFSVGDEIRVDGLLFEVIDIEGDVLVMRRASLWRRARRWLHVRWHAIARYIRS